MSMKHPIIAVTGSSGAGTTTVKHTFEAIFHRENVNAAVIEGDSFHRYPRDEMKRLIDEAEARGERGISHFGPEANLITDLEQIFRAYGDSATGRRRHYVHNEAQSLRWNLPMGTFTEWEDLPVGTDCLFYEGLHGAMVTEDVNIARHVDLLIGVVPTINLEWIQKLHRDTRLRGYSKDAVQDTILRRMHDYVHYIVPQFSHTHINFQRVPVVDTSNPFSSRDIPTLEESMVVVRFKDPRGVDFPYLLNMISGSFMSRANTIVVPGGRLDLAMQLVLTPLIWKLMERRRQWV
ncbi:MULTISPECIES: phosphoribulokinase [Denitromonas]|uniref:phosphoribulokinase n=2 Tax=Denitromonas TaxID=139331 RepID=A0A558EUL8_9RHOO|nr:MULTISPECIES: phosphoribulokinase [Denitromonas]TVO51191.1 phosphoribulokinase [Denitromonas halophila]TVO63146.1 phosphoribulokinase [Denitromonas ohlonensis]TVO71669.1 phosphoribulokinase [Denitromonas ohlonensis]TVT45748.1 MAG: phosphoribulokinase [Denitromonas halophila]TVT71914.1 MAG: phosphoribulokinase [Denitromonas halophila]